MEDGSSKTIYIAAAVVLAALVAVLAFSFYTKSRSTASAAMSKVDKMSVALMESDYTQYEGTTVMGSEVINVIKQLGDEDVAIMVDNGSGTPQRYGSAYITIQQACDRANSGAYINQSSRFLATITRDTSTDAITELVFTKQ